MKSLSVSVFTTHPHQTSLPPTPHPHPRHGPNTPTPFPAKHIATCASCFESCHKTKDIYKSERSTLKLSDLAKRKQPLHSPPPADGRSCAARGVEPTPEGRRALTPDGRAWDHTGRRQDTLLPENSSDLRVSVRSFLPCQISPR